MDTNNTSNAIQSKPLTLQPMAAAVLRSAPQPIQNADTVAVAFSEINSNNKKSVDSLLNNRQELTHALDELKRLADNSGRALGFAHDDAINGPVITVSDLETGKVVRQIPTEVVVRVAHSIEKMKGLLFDKAL